MLRRTQKELHPNKGKQHRYPSVDSPRRRAYRMNTPPAGRGTETMDDKRITLPVMGERPTPAAAPPPELPADASLSDRVVAAMKTVYDPEIPVNIHDLGLIYELAIS